MRAPVPALQHPGPTTGLQAGPTHPQPVAPIRSDHQGRPLGLFPVQSARTSAGVRRLARALGSLLAIVLLLVGSISALAAPAAAALDDDRYDGNIFALYAGNGSLVPPRSSLAKALEDHRTTVVVYYLDDDAASKQFSAVVSELQRVWLNNIELIPLVTDPLQNRADTGPSDPAHYWSGLIPQVVVFNSEGQVVFDEQGAVSVDAINAAVSQATGIPLPEGGTTSTTESFNELNSEVVSR